MVKIRKPEQSPAARHCRMCGTTVTVGPDDRCVLGHPVGPPQPLTSTPPAVEPVQPPVNDRLMTVQIFAAPPRSHATPPAGPSHDEPLAHPYDEVLAWAAAVRPALATAAASASVATLAPAPLEHPADRRSFLDDLLASREPAPFLPDASVDQLPPPPLPEPVPPAPARTEPARIAPVDEEAQPAPPSTPRRPVRVLLGTGVLAAAAGFAAALYIFPA